VFSIVPIVLGGYVFASAVAAGLSYLLPMARADAVLTGLMVSVAAYAGAVLWAFAARTVGRAWLGLAIPSLAFVCLAWLIRFGSAP
jgi:predicted CDP-diglyceride synthetase/phosphatidate cytidylyltransferase